MALSVLLYHFKCWTVGVPDSSTVLGRLGIYAVSAFFIISGMSLYIAYRKTEWNKKAVISFVIKRYIRLAPAFWAACIVMVAVLLITEPNYLISWKQLFYNMTLTFGFFRPESYITVGGWSIGNEVVFYAMLPIILWSLAKRKLAIISALALALAFHIFYAFFMLSPEGEYTSAKWFTYIQPGNNVFLFLAGIAIAWASIELKLPKSKLYLLPIIMCIAAFCIYPAEGHLINIMTGWNRLWFTVICVSLCFCVFNLTVPSDSSAGKALALLGDLSYAIYMFHGITGEITVKIIAPQLGITALEDQLDLLNYFTLPVTLLISYAFFTRVEKPSMLLSRNIDKTVEWGKKLVLRRR